MKNQKQILLLSAFLFISLYSYCSTTSPTLAKAKSWLENDIWNGLQPILVTILGIAGGYFLTMLGLMYVREIEDEKKKNKYMMGGLVLGGAATILALI